MRSAVAADPRSRALRRARVGDLLPDAVVERSRARRIDATAFVIPGAGGLSDYAASLLAARDDFGPWDGRAVILEPDGGAPHLVVIVDRYGQVYDVTESADAAGLPTAAALEEWFRFLATACPECGVIDDPIGRRWVP